MTKSRPNIVRHIEVGATCCDPLWEAAYKRFETPEEEVDKFCRRLKSFGLHQQRSEMRVVELFCGRGGGLVALAQLGFTDISGVDLSETLLQQYEGDAQLHLADCRQLPFEDDSFDAVIVQGGLHHLPTLPDDLDQVAAEVRRVLRSDGTFYAVEPWLTPFLRFVHAVVQQPLVRRFYRKGDALAEMIEHERDTYERWLERPDEIRAVLDRHFKALEFKTKWGKLIYRGSPNGGAVAP